MGFFLIALLAPHEGSAKDPNLAQVLAFRQDLLAGKYDIKGLRDGSALAPSSISEAALTRAWFERAHFKLLSSQLRSEFLVDQLEDLSYQDPHLHHISPEKIEALYLLIEPLDSLYLSLKHQKRDLRRYYEKKLAQQQRSWLQKIRLRKFVRGLKYYHEVEVSKLERQLCYFQATFIAYSEGLQQRAQKLAALCADQGGHHPEKSQECVVCYENIRETQDPDGTADPQAAGLQLPCQHAFHQACILEWLETHNTCPICRQEVITE